MSVRDTVSLRDIKKGFIKFNKAKALHISGTLSPAFTEINSDINKKPKYNNHRHYDLNGNQSIAVPSVFAPGHQRPEG